MSPTDAMQLVEDCESRESRLSDWEREFIDSLKAQLSTGHSLTGRQSDTLNDIWDRATARG